MIFRCPLTRVLRLSPFLATHQHEQRWWMIPLQPFTFVWARETWKLKFDGGLQKNREYMGIYIYIYTNIYIYMCIHKTFQGVPVNRHPATEPFGTQTGRGPVIHSELL